MRGRLFAKLCDGVKTVHTALFTGYLNWKKKYYSHSSNSGDTNLCYVDDFIQKPVHLVEFLKTM